ncbi:helix-turn-helix domain-containing protein [Leptotrichia alba]|uniref:Helix-turn-helix domain-containing protein n=1 Tax=Leptotrichia alba TaxID=3239304 RepID=A0AB39V3N9_9FUSO
MAVFKVNKNNNYTVISNTHLKERKMTLKAKGLLTLMLSLPPDWGYSIEGLISICVEGERAINSTLNELKEFGYLRIEKLPPRKGKNQFEYIYNIYEKPLKKEERQLKNVEVQNVGLQNVKLQSEAVQNEGQLKTNTLNTKLLNTYSLFMEKWNELANECELGVIIVKPI